LYNAVVIPTHRIVHLQPKEYELRWEGDGLTPASSYPQPVLFIPDENIEPEEINDPEKLTAKG
jgi:hypothetical protein